MCTTFVVTGLSASTSYQFSVAATDSAGSSAQSARISVTTTASGPPPNGGHQFAPYIDMSLTPDEQLLTIQQQSGIKVFTLAFIIDNGSRQPSWGGLGQTLPNDSLPNGTTISSLIQGVRNAGGDVIVSFGGALGAELADSFARTSVSQLQAAYQQVITKYNLKMIDFDIETSANGIDKRSQAIAGLVAANPGLQVSLTLPVLPTGLVTTGLNVLQSAKKFGAPIAVVNVMAMDYGSANDNGGKMGLDATLAAQNTRNQVQSAGLTATIGVTAMIGVNDTNTEIFQLSDAQMLVNFAHQNTYISRLSFWSVARDNGSCPGQGFASATCSGVAQSNYQFSQIFETF